MPLVTRKRCLGADGDKLESTCPKRRKTGRKELCQFEKVGYSQDHHHSLHRSLPEGQYSLQKILAKEIGSFLNGKGGILCFGCRENGTVYGAEISRKEEDNLKLIIDEVFKKFRPIVEPQNYRVTFTPLRQGSEWNARVVLEIRVQAGDQYEMYEDYNHETYLRQQEGPYGPLVPHEIKRFTTQQLRQKLKAIRPIQKLLNTPRKESSALDGGLGTQKITTKLLSNKNGKMRIKVIRRLDSSSGSDEDPISIAVVKPMIPEVGKCTTTQQENGAGSGADTAEVATQDSSNAGNGALSTQAAPLDGPRVKFAVNRRRSSSQHPLAQSFKSTFTPAASRPSQIPKPNNAVTTRSRNSSPNSKSAAPKPTTTAKPSHTGTAVKPTATAKPSHAGLASTSKAVKPTATAKPSHTGTASTSKAVKPTATARPIHAGLASTSKAVKPTATAKPSHTGTASTSKAVKPTATARPIHTGLASTSKTVKPTATAKPNHTGTASTSKAVKPTATARPIHTGLASTSKAVKPANNSTTHSSATRNTSKIPTRNSSAHPCMPAHPVNASSGYQYPTGKKGSVSHSGSGKMIPTSTYHQSSTSQPIWHHPPQQGTHYSLPPPPPPPHLFHYNVAPPYHMHYAHHQAVSAHMAASQANPHLRSYMPYTAHVDMPHAHVRMYMQ